ncbi:F-box domain-containing protein [Podospora conica]|nr:F-box domain-containing protein [Schizothecium conicum]
MDSHASINSIPNEILLSILDFFRTAHLLPLAAVNRRFSSLVLRLIRQRLIRGASLPNHRLILECYHPSAKLSTPYLFCDYLFTDGLEDPATDPLTLPGLRGAYSHFRPVAQDENQRARRRYPRAEGSSSTPPVEPPTQDVFLDETEPFSQLCAVTNLVEVGPKPGLFLSHVNVGDGVVRVWRDWLAAQARNREGVGAPILWADARQSVGVRFRVRRREGEWVRAPVLVAADEEEPVTYRLEFDEVVVRAGELLVGLERSEEQGVTTSGKAVMIVSSG